MTIEKKEESFVYSIKGGRLNNVKEVLLGDAIHSDTPFDFKPIRLV